LLGGGDGLLVGRAAFVAHDARLSVGEVGGLASLAAVVLFGAVGDG